MARSPDQATPLVITPGDPRGIGPEVVAKTLAARPDASVIVLGDPGAFAEQAEQVGLVVHRVRAWPERLPAEGVTLLDPGGDDEPVEVASIRQGVAACLDGRARGLVTGPIHKARLAARGFAHPGHTDFLGELCGVDDPVMAFVGGRLMVALVTVHLPLRAVPDAVTTRGVLHVLRTTDAALRVQLGVGQRRLLVCGLNPHAGDDGLLGREEIEIIEPAVREARSEGIDARGPLSAETAFRQAELGEGEMVIAMYHDQGLAPLKRVDFGQSVNWTLGLPIVRTSVDHGTADDIAGQGVADPSSLGAALAWAERLTAS